MKSITRGNIKTAIASVKAAKWRSLMTMMGIIIGIVSVVTVVSIGEGVKRQVVNQINNRGRELITVRPGQLVNRNNQGEITGVNLFSGLSATGSLTEKDVQAIERTKGVRQAVPLSILAGGINFRNQTYNNVTVIGTTAELPEVLKQKVEFGGFFSESDENQNGVIVGKNVATDVFREEVPLGQSFEFQGQTFIVRGVFKEFKNALISLDTDFNNAIFMPHQVAKELTNNNAAIYQVLAQPADPGRADTVAASIKKNVASARGGQEDFTVLKQDESLGVTSNILNLFTRLIAGIAAISLLVGGIGIMNVMLVSVTERMHEIGIRKAIGATSRQIMSQFLLEASVLSVIGGIIGLAVSLLINLLLRILTDLEPVVSWPVVVIATGVSLLVGIIFGTAPALKAAKKDPIQALRHE
ncbi:MAG TPA: ABC transporter permease [Candidatus Saccharimonadales bacterium]|nr:ABC transporter permease [Candidatus Saccharimonadales bacterium]